MKLENLKTTAHCGFCECIKQSWNNSDIWYGYANFPRPNNAFVLVCSDMEIRYNIDGGKIITVRKGDIVFIPKNLKYTASFSNCNGAFDSYTINFVLFDEHGVELEFDEGFRIWENKIDKTCLFLAEALSEAYINRINNRIRPQIQFYMFLEKMCELSSCTSQFYEPIRAGVELLIKEYTENKKIDYYAKHCNMDRSYFYKLFKAWSGLAPNEYRNKLRISTAKLMLKNTNMTVYQISEKIGFIDPYYFSRIFKKEEGISPLRYRNITK